MEIRTVSVQNDKAPVSGTALYVVVDERDRHVTLLHPVTLSKFDIPVDEYRSGMGQMLWPENQTHMKFSAETIAELMQRQMKDYSKRQKQYPAQIVRRIISELRGIEVEKVPLYKDAPKQSEKRSAKRPGVIDAIVAELHKGASLDEMVKALKEAFPDRNAEGMRTTVRCQINRLPAKLNLKIIKIEDKKRGQLFKFATSSK